jgi:hypothetical protein
MVEQDAAAGVEAVTLPIIYGYLVGEQLRTGVRAARMKAGVLILRRRLAAEHLARGCLIKTAAEVCAADRFEQAQRSHSHHVRRVLGDVEAHTDMALSAQIVDFVGPDFREARGQRAGVGEIGIVEKEPGAGAVGVFIQVVDAIGVEGRCATFQSVDLVAFGEKKLGEIGTVLSGDPGDQGLGHRVLHFSIGTLDLALHYLR